MEGQQVRRQRSEIRRQGGIEILKMTGSGCGGAVKCLLGEVRIEGEGVPHGQAAHDEEGGSIHEDSQAADASAT